MHQDYQNILINSRYHYLLKYDGQRKQNRYTVRAFDSLDADHVHGGDTDTPEVLLERLLTQLESHAGSASAAMFHDFRLLLNRLIARFGEDLVCALSFKNNTSEPIQLDVSYNNNHIHYQGHAITDIEKDIDNRCGHDTV